LADQSRYWRQIGRTCASTGGIIGGAGFGELAVDEVFVIPL
jgi:hypothetical protein